jgi:hypothetical protein
VIIGAVHASQSCPSTNVRSKFFRKEKPSNQLVVHQAVPCVHFGPALSSSYVTCGFVLTAPNPAVVPVYNSIDMEGRFGLEAHLGEEIG